MQRAIRVAAVLAAPLCAIGLFTLPAARRFACDSAFEQAVHAAADRPDVLLARLAVRTAPPRFGAVFSSNAAKGFALAAIVQRAGAATTPEVLHDAGVAALVSGDAVAAVRLLTAATEREADASRWSDLAAARHELALATKRDEEVLASLSASAHALSLRSRFPEAEYNFALGVELLGVRPAALQAWKNYLARSGRASWKRVAEAHLRSLAQPTSAEVAARELRSLKPRDSAALRRIATAHPQQARLWGEGPVLAWWAEAALAGDAPLADARLSDARVIGDVLSASTGESLLHDAVAALDHARSDRRRWLTLIDAHVRYATARRLYADARLQEALEEFAAAEAKFVAGKSPMAFMAASFSAFALHDADRLAEATAIVDRLLAAPLSDSYQALRAQLHYERARLNATQGYWSDCLDSALVALSGYDRLREPGNKAMAQLLIAEAHGYLGQPAVSIRQNLAGIRLAAQEGDTSRLRVASANLCREFMRRRDWQTAKALIGIERLLQAVKPDETMATDTSVRAAVIEENLGRPASARRELQNAEGLASLIEDTALRGSLIADVDGARGALARQRNPGEAIKYLSRAISYQERTRRALLLPQLYLERARAHLALRNVTDALRDLELGIRHLERQRSQVRHTAMRYGIFDDASELFADLIALHLSRGDREAAFAALERGRARALLEQIAGTTPTTFEPVGINAIQRRMPTGTLLIEYAVLRDRVVLFGIANDLFAVREIAVDSATVGRNSTAWIDELVGRRAISDVQARASELRRVLLGPMTEHVRYRTLVFVPDAVLQQVPFAALYDARSRQYLIERHVVVIAPSTAVFLAARARPLERLARASAAVFAATRGDVALSLRALPEAERESTVVAAAYERSVVVGPRASIRDFLSESGRHDIVHFAGHALIDVADPSRSALVFAGSGDRPSVLWRCSEIGMTRLRRVRVLVLAACSTMRGRAGRTDGTPSIARSFLAAGVPVVVGTLWDIEDGEPSTLLEDFHEKVARGILPAAALRDAQLAALQGGFPATRHPGSWAAFAVLGAGV